MSILTIRHTPAEGTLVLGTSRNDPAVPLLKQHRLRWSGNIGEDGAWYRPHSRDKIADTRFIAALSATLEAGGHEVTVEVDDADRRSPADREADAAVKAEDRADRFAGYARSAAGRADARHAAGRQILDHIPMGQPLLIGHHSYAADLNRRRRAWNHMDRAAEERAKAEEWARRAKSAGITQAYRESGRVTQRRVEKLEADERALLRRLGEERRAQKGDPAGQLASPTRLDNQLALLTDELTFWREHLAALFESGDYRPWTKEMFRVGDLVNVIDRWYPVARVNGKSVSVPPLIGLGGTTSPSGQPWSWTDTVSYDKVFGRRRDGKQLDRPGDEEWPVEEALQVDRWRRLLATYERDRRHSSRAADWTGRWVPTARRRAFGLPDDASAADLLAAETADGRTARDQALACIAAYDAMASRAS